jgi:hypothetical protein
MVLFIITKGGSSRVYSLSSLKDLNANGNRVCFPGAVNSKFTTAMTFEHPSTYPAIPTYRCTSPDGEIIDPSISSPPNNLALTMYENMLRVSIMDIIMFDSQRQGRLSFYMTSQGEEGTCVGSASALEARDVIFSQYREAGVFMQRGFTFADFMNQLFANKNDVGRGRNMPVHYGSKALNIVCVHYIIAEITVLIAIIAYGNLPISNADTSGSRSSICSKDAAPAKSKFPTPSSSLLFRRRSSIGRGFSRCP